MCPPGLVAGRVHQGLGVLTLVVSLRARAQVAKPFAVPMGKLEEGRETSPHSAAPNMQTQEMLSAKQTLLR